jgi:hypothetical protein
VAAGGNLYQRHNNGFIWRWSFALSLILVPA